MVIDVPFLIPDGFKASIWVPWTETISQKATTHSFIRFCKIFNISHSLLFLKLAKIVNIQQKTREHVLKTKSSCDFKHFLSFILDNGRPNMWSIQSYHMCWRIFCGNPVCKKTSDISIPDTKPSLSQSICLNSALNLRRSTWLTTQGIVSISGPADWLIWAWNWHCRCDSIQKGILKLALVGRYNLHN